MTTTTTDNGTTSRRGAPSKYTDDQVDTARKILESGGTLKEAAEAAGMSVQAVQYHKRRYGIRGPRDTSTQTVTDPLAAKEEQLMTDFDNEITRAEETIARLQARLREVGVKRNRMAKALGHPERTIKV